VRYDEGISKHASVSLQELNQSKLGWLKIPEDREPEISLHQNYEDNQIREYQATAKYTQRVGTSRVRTETSFKIVQRKGGCGIAFGCPSFLGKLTAALYSQAVFDEAGGFMVKNFEKRDFQKFWDYALKIGGTLRDVHLRDIEGGKISVYRVSGKDILRAKGIGNLVELLKHANRIKRLGFGFPPNCLSDSAFHFWIANWGGGTLYEPPEPSSYHLFALADFFEQALREREG